MPTPSDLFSLVALDMNGTTVEDNGIFDTSLAAALAAVGAPAPDPSALHAVRGMAKRDMFRSLLPAGDDADRAYSEFTAEFAASIGRGAVAPIDGVDDVLRQLRQLGLAIALITGFPHELQQAMIAELGWVSLVDLSVSTDDVPRGRPYPDLIHHAARHCGVTDTRRIVVAGDTTNDLEAGRAAGAGLVVGVLTGSHDAARLGSVPDTCLIDSVADLPDLLVAVALEA
jgi:phosphoglycolate phosphatase